jgi:predicted nucleotidyltransferase
MSIELSAINKYAMAIKRKFYPQSVILYGSYANGDADNDSDVDLLVIMETKLDPIEQAVIIRKQLPTPFPLDLLVRRPSEIKKRIKDGDNFFRMLFKHGKKL